MSAGTASDVGGWQNMRAKRLDACMDRLVEMYRLGQISLEQQQKLWRLITANDEESVQLALVFLDEFDDSKHHMTTI